MPRPRAALAMSTDAFTEVFDDLARERLTRVVAVDLGATRRDFEDASDVEVLITGWGAPRLGADELAAMPELRAVFHSAGTVKTFLGAEVFDRGITVSSAADANAIPVAEFTYAAIVFGAKRVWPMAHWYRTNRRSRDISGLEWLGTNGITIGVVGASRIGRRVMRLLRHLDAEVLLYDPFVSEAEAAAYGATLTELDPLLDRSEVVTVHAPATPQTRHLLDARRLARLRDGAVLINTSRGSLIDHKALLAELETGRIDAVLDVTDPEPPPVDSPLYVLPNVLLTPHIAGALGNETTRLGAMAVAELERFCSGQSLEHEVTSTQWHRIA